MILHICSDNRFLAYSIKQFEEVAPGDNQFLIEVSDVTKPLKFVENASNVCLVKPGSSEYFDWCLKLSNYSMVIMHSLNGSRVKLINKSPKNVVFAWIPWGVDVFYLNKNLNLIQPFTRQFLKKDHWNNQVQKYLVDAFNLIRNFGTKETQKRRALKRISYFFSREDSFRVVQPFNPKMERFDYFYYSIEETLGSIKDNKISGNNILIGNSATPTNNHADIYNSLSSLKPFSGRLVTPLSYGDEKYKQKVVELGSRLFPDNFEPLVELLSLEEYNKIVNSCNIVIMNHIRPQAFGNILTALWMGAKVYLNKENTLYGFYKKLGLLIFSIDEDLLKGNDQALQGLSEKEIAYNRGILLEEFSYEKSLKRVQRIVDRVIAL